MNLTGLPKLTGSDGFVESLIDFLSRRVKFPQTRQTRQNSSAVTGHGETSI
jgi:hypothetical protein